ncbi:MAG TPA: response regulator [Mucilaginibacter sp.]|jgi:signal transduction histidine kinase|nr:response regulator [Mucilaginibacter sp.]
MNTSVAETINLLIVDDKADNIMVIESTLEREGLNIFTTTSPKKVEQMCIDNDISIALIDVMMPEINGYELLDRIKKNPLTSHIMVILITGFSMGTDEVIKGLGKGAVDYLFKPLDLYITNAKVNSLITLVNQQKDIQRKNKQLESYQQELFKVLEESEKSKITKENFLANMSHEIRTPLNAIIGLTHLLKDSQVDNKQREMINLMGFSSKALLGIVNDILESAKIDAGKVTIVRKETDIIKLLKTICELTGPMANEKGLALRCDISKDVPPVIMADALRINQILMNLINNAIKFTSHGSIQIGLKLLERDDERALLEFSVKDSGVGIPKSSIDKIFTRFEQVEDKTWQKFGGTGLGLSIVKKLIYLKGGKLNIESELGVGTTFTFSNWFTLVDKKDLPDADENKLNNVDFNNMSILLVEDNPVNQYIVVEMLKEWNIIVDVADNGVEAFEKLKHNHYSLILMDTHMPVMNGNETTKKIRNEMPDEKKDIPIISFSASVIEIERNEAKDAGVDDFIEKPFEPAKLVNKIRKLTK